MMMKYKEYNKQIILFSRIRKKKKTEKKYDVIKIHVNIVRTKNNSNFETEQLGRKILYKFSAKRRTLE